MLAEILTAADMPDGCVCNPAEWHWGIIPICGLYQPSLYNPAAAVLYCDMCQHDPGCHEDVRRNRGADAS